MTSCTKEVPELSDVFFAFRKLVCMVYCITSKAQREAKGGSNRIGNANRRNSMSCVVDKSGPALMSWQKGMWAIADAIKFTNGKCV